MERECKQCGKSFETSSRCKYLCDECVAANRKENVLRERTCRQCGKGFEGGPRAWYCPECRAKRKRERAKTYRVNGFSRHLGDIDHCQNCGKEYIIEAGGQQYCKECAKTVVAAKDAEAARAYFAKNQNRMKEIRKPLRRCIICGREITAPYKGKLCGRKECAEARKKQYAENGVKE